MTDDTNDAPLIEFRTRWTVQAIALSLAAFWNVVGAAVFAAFGDWPAAALAVQAALFAGYGAWLRLEG